MTQAMMAQGRHDIHRRSAPGRVSPPAMAQINVQRVTLATEQIIFNTARTPWAAQPGLDRPAPHRG